MTKTRTARPASPASPFQRTSERPAPRPANRDSKPAARAGGKSFAAKGSGSFKPAKAAERRPSAADGPASKARSFKRPDRTAISSAPKVRSAKPEKSAAAPKTTPFQKKKLSAGNDLPSAPGAKINRRAADRLRLGHLWVYASDIESVELPTSEIPALLPVADSRGLLLGTALYSPTSQIALRMISREAVDEAAWLILLETRLHTAIQRRKALLDKQTDACRLCFSEADELPGLVVDKYGELVIVQLLAKGLDSAAVRAVCVRVLCAELDPAAILERPDPRMRELEGLAAPNPEPLFVRAAATLSLSTKFRLNGLTFQYDANSGQKTGAFLDQRANYAAAADWARRLGLGTRDGGGRALDVCCYQGGFALHLAAVCAQVTGIDASRASLEVAEQNFAANRSQLAGQIEWVEADAFQILRDWSEAGEKFDAIVLDPPAFAKSQRAVEGALRGYKELNLRALKMLRPGGLLVTCSCSHHVGWTELEASVASAAADAHRRVRLIERRGASLDHPVILSLPETEYLKCLVLEVE
jgi:23S rRNA (cytosine1962-C5)-methyltransferase